MTSPLMLKRDRKGKIRYWTDAEISILHEHYPTAATVDDLLALLPGRSVAAIHGKAYNLRLSRPRFIGSKSIGVDVVEYIAGLTMLKGKPPTLARTREVAPIIEGHHCGWRRATTIRRRAIRLAHACGWSQSASPPKSNPAAIGDKVQVIEPKLIRFKPWERQLLLDFGARLPMVELKFLMPRRSRGEIIQLLQYLGLELVDNIKDTEPLVRHPEVQEHPEP